MTLSYVTDLGSLASYAEWFSSPWFAWGCSLISLAIGYDWIEGKIDTVHMMYFGIAAALIVELCSAAYIVYKLVQSTVNIGILVASSYTLKSITGNLLGYYEFFYFSLYNFTAFGIVVMAFFGSIRLWELIEERVEGAAEGFFGRAVSWHNAIKFVPWAPLLLWSPTTLLTPLVRPRTKPSSSSRHLILKVSNLMDALAISAALSAMLLQAPLFKPT